MNCKNCSNQIDADAKFCNHCGTKTDNELNNSLPVEKEKVVEAITPPTSIPKNNYIPPKDNRTPLEKGLFSFIWDSQLFSWIAIIYDKISNFIGFLISLFLIFVIGGYIGVSLGVLALFGLGTEVYQSNLRKKKQFHTNCTKCNHEVKIGTQFCPKCGEVILVQTIESDMFSEANDAISLNKKKKSLMFLIVFILIIELFF